MKRHVKKLALSKHTIRDLQASAMKDAAGGQTLATCSALCSDIRCPDTKPIHGCASGDGF